jgi:hypothetical protein
VCVVPTTTRPAANTGAARPTAQRDSQRRAPDDASSATTASSPRHAYSVPPAASGAAETPYGAASVHASLPSAMRSAVSPRAVPT